MNPHLFVCLNPFEFRAGQKGEKWVYDAEADGLNPFEFRAGQKGAQGYEVVRAWVVLIPSNSGLAKRAASDAQKVLKMGLNPFEFRAGQKGEPAAGDRVAGARLNPFEFRAGQKGGAGR